jgi:hypothetical protein
MPSHKERYDQGELATTDGQAPVHFGSPAPNMEVGHTGQHKAYWVLSEAERAKGFVRPVRRTYTHVGKRPTFPTRDLTPEEQTLYEGAGYVQFEPYPPRSGAVGRFWTAKELRSGCGTVTRMGNTLAETYARDPGFYGATYCCECQDHLPVGVDGEFVWEGTDERVGT